MTKGRREKGKKRREEEKKRRRRTKRYFKVGFVFSGFQIFCISDFF